MKKIALAGFSAAAALTMVVSGCATNETSGTTTNSATGSSSSTGSTTASLSGTLTGQGASTQQVAQTAWIAGFQTANSAVTVNYNPVGSGAGVEAFTGGGADWAGSDKALSSDQLGGTFALCAAGTTPIDIPTYISPIALVFNVQGVKDLNLSADVAAKIFLGKITKWNDPAIVALNPGVTLPDLAITAVHRSDKSGTTNNFTDWLNQVAPTTWTTAAAEVWPVDSGEAAKGTSGVVAAVKNGSGTIGYADASQVTDMTVAKIGENGTYYAPSAEAAAKIVSAAPVVTGRAANDLALSLDRKADGYPVVLVSYSIACSQYKDSSKAALVKAYLTYITSSEGQNASVATAGNAPLAGDLATKVATAAASIS